MAVSDGPHGPTGSSTSFYNVAIIGPGEDATEQDIGDAYELGRLLAATGRVRVVTGGLGGVMASAIRGANSVAGPTIALLPGDDSTESGVPASALHAVLPTGLGELRNALLVRTSALVVSVGGSDGTQSEISTARRIDKPLISIRPWRLMTSSGEPVPAGIEAQDAASACAEAVTMLGIESSP